MSYSARGHTRRVGIDDQANGAGRRSVMRKYLNTVKEAVAN
jgi:hypothetical protein